MRSYDLDEASQIQKEYKALKTNKTLKLFATDYGRHLWKHFQQDWLFF